MYNSRLVPLAQKLRKEMTREERRLWYNFLREYPVRFRRQKIISNYIVDFYCAAAKLVIELDGSQHYEEQGQQYDLRRTAVLEQFGLYVFRVPNNAVLENFEGVCTAIDALVKARNLQDAP